MSISFFTAPLSYTVVTSAVTALLRSSVGKPSASWSTMSRLLYFADGSAGVVISLSVGGRARG